jgi:hypothetical protein
MMKNLRLFTIILLTFLVGVSSFAQQATNWAQPTPRTIIGGGDRWRFVTPYVWMNELNIGGTTGTDGYLIINGVVYNGDNDLELVFSITNMQNQISNLQAEDILIHGRIDTNANAIASNTLFIVAVSNALDERITSNETWIANYTNTVTGQINSNRENIEILFGITDTNAANIATNAYQIQVLSNLVWTFDDRITSNRTDIEILYTNDTLQKVVENSGGTTAMATGIFTRTVYTNVVGHYLFYNEGTNTWGDTELEGMWFGYTTNQVGLEPEVFAKPGTDALLYFITNQGTSNGWFISKNGLLNPVSYILTNNVYTISSNDFWIPWGGYTNTLGKTRWVEWDIETNDLTKTIWLFDTNCDYSLKIEGDIEVVNVENTYLDSTNNVLPLWALDSRYCNYTNTDWQFVVENSNVVSREGVWFDYYILEGWTNLLLANNQYFIRDLSYVKQPCWRRWNDGRGFLNDDRLYYETSYAFDFWVLNFGGSPKVFTTNSIRPDASTVWVTNNLELASGFSGPIGITRYFPTQIVQQAVSVVETNPESRALWVDGLLQLTGTHDRHTNNVLPMWMNDWRYAPTSAIPYLEETKIDQDGSVPMLADFDMNTNSILNVSNITFFSTNSFISNLGRIDVHTAGIGSRTDIGGLLHMGGNPITNVDYIVFDDGTILDETGYTALATKSQSGSDYPDSGTTEKIIDFPTEFSSIPVVTCNLGTNAGMQITVDIISITESNFTYTQRSSAGLKTNDWLIRWIAIRP